jgi:glutaredoxin
MEGVMLDGLRGKAFGALRSTFGNKVPPVRWTKDLLLFVNEMAGKPLASADELVERRERERERRQKVAEAHEKRMADLRAQGSSPANGAAKAKGEAAPVTIYVDEKSGRELKRIRTVLKGRDIPFKELDVEHDEASRSWVCTTAGRHEMPIVFVGDKPVGAYDELVQLDVSGELSKMVYGR